MASLSHAPAWLVALVATCSAPAKIAPSRPTDGPEGLSETGPRPTDGPEGLSETGPRPGWVDISVRIPDAVLDIRYATAENFTGQVLYPVARCLVRAEVAERLAAAADTLRAQSHRLLLWDCYRPASIQRELWRLVPDSRYVAEPTFDDAGKPIGGSKHSRGAAVDVSLADAHGTPREMPTAHDFFGPEASGAKATGAAAKNHAALRAAMTAAGFEPMPTEWWHYDASNWTSYPLSDEPLR